jgi:hypothetical protein
MKAQEIFATYNSDIMSTYTRSPLIFVKGKMVSRAEPSVKGGMK